MSSIVHCKKDKYDIYIGRPRSGQEWGFGNPFSIGEDGDRDEVIEKFRNWLLYGETYDNVDASYFRRKWILRKVHLLKGKTLGCWCHPKRCHGEVLIELANK